MFLIVLIIAAIEHGWTYAQGTRLSNDLGNLIGIGSQLIQIGLRCYPKRGVIFGLARPLKRSNSDGTEPLCRYGARIQTPSKGLLA